MFFSGMECADYMPGVSWRGRADRLAKGRS